MRTRRPARTPGRVVVRSVGIALAAATLSTMLSGQATPPQPAIAARAKQVITVDGLRFKDLNGDGSLEPYEDWRLSADERVTDLVGRMTLAEKSGVMLIDTLNANCEGALPAAASRPLLTPVCLGGGRASER